MADNPDDSPTNTDSSSDHPKKPPRSTSDPHKHPVDDEGRHGSEDEDSHSKHEVDEPSEVHEKADDDDVGQEEAAPSHVHSHGESDEEGKNDFHTSSHADDVSDPVESHREVDTYPIDEVTIPDVDLTPEITGSNSHVDDVRKPSETENDFPEEVITESHSQPSESHDDVNDEVIEPSHFEAPTRPSESYQEPDAYPIDEMTIPTHTESAFKPSEVENDVIQEVAIPSNTEAPATPPEPESDIINEMNDTITPVFSVPSESTQQDHPKTPPPPYSEHFSDTDHEFNESDYGKPMILTEDTPLVEPSKKSGSSYLKKGGVEAPSKQKIENYGDFLTFGWYTVLFMFMYEFLMLPQMGNMTFMVYGAYTPLVVACGNHSFTGMLQRDVCEQLPAIINSTGCTPTLYAQFESLGYELGYYCGSAQIVKKMVSIQMIGVFFGAPIFGQASDWWGRRRVIQISVLVVCLLDIFVARTTNLWHFTIVQTINMIFVGGMNTVMHVYVVENVPKRHRVWIMMLVSFSPNIIIFAALAYWAQTWRNLISIAGYLTIPAGILLFLCYESPRWQIEKGNLKKAEKDIRAIERINGTLTKERSLMITDLIEKEAQAIEQSKKKKQKLYMYHLFYTAQMSKWILVIAYGLFCTAMISYAMVFNMEQFSGSIYMNSAMLGVFRMILNISLGASDYIFPNLGRKVIHQGALVYVISMIGLVTFMKGTGIINNTITTMASLSATGLCSQLFVVNNVIIAELFPTAIRNVAASFVSTVARFGGVVSPQLFLIENYWIAAPYLMIVITMSINFIIFQLFIPETKGSPMPDKFPEKSERMWRRKEKPTHLLERVDTSIAKLADQE